MRSSFTHLEPVLFPLAIATESQSERLWRLGLRGKAEFNKRRQLQIRIIAQHGSCRNQPYLFIIELLMCMTVWCDTKRRGELAVVVV